MGQNLRHRGLGASFLILMFILIVPVQGETAQFYTRITSVELGEHEIQEPYAWHLIELQLEVWNPSNQSITISELPRQNNTCIAQLEFNHTFSQSYVENFSPCLIDFDFTQRIFEPGMNQLLSKAFAIVHPTMDNGTVTDVFETGSVFPTIVFDPLLDQNFTAVYSTEIKVSGNQTIESIPEELPYEYGNVTNTTDGLHMRVYIEESEALISSGIEEEYKLLLPIMIKAELLTTGYNTKGSPCGGGIIIVVNGEEERNYSHGCIPLIIDMEYRHGISQYHHNVTFVQKSDNPESFASINLEIYYNGPSERQHESSAFLEINNMEITHIEYEESVVDWSKYPPVGQTLEQTTSTVSSTSTTNQAYSPLLMIFVAIGLVGYQNYRRSARK